MILVVLNLTFVEAPAQYLGATLILSVPARHLSSLKKSLPNECIECYTFSNCFDYEETIGKNGYKILFNHS